MGTDAGRAPGTSLRAVAVTVSVSLLSAVLFAACERRAAETDCDIDKAPCVKRIGEGLSVSFDITPKPVKSMAALVCRVALAKGADPLDGANVAVNFTMPGMIMATNRVRLARKDAGVYEGRCVIVRCPSAHKIWRAEIDIESPGNRPAAADFTFKVAR